MRRCAFVQSGAGAEPLPENKGRKMNARSCSALLFVACLASPARGELWVDQSAPAGGNGSSQAPFQSINQAVRARRPGDVITIRKGVYSERVTLSVSGSAARPTVLRAAPGERVVLSGFAAIKGWQPEADGIYTTTVDGPVSDLYVGLRPQPVSRWPDIDQPLRHIASPDAKAGSFQDAAGLADEPILRELAAAPASTMAFLYVARGNYYTTVAVKGIERATGTVTLTAAVPLEGKADRYQLVNHRSLIRKPGQWAFTTAGDKQARLYFRPQKADDLGHTQYRKEPSRILAVGHFRDTISHVRVEGLEICGSAKDGLELGRTDHVTVSRCIFHNNGGVGVSSRRSDHVEFQNNVSVANGDGMGITSGHHVLVEGNEIALNLVDGIDVAGNVSGRPGGEPESSDITIRRNYIHHHLLLGHPDNIQAYRWVKNFTIEDNVLLFGGQGIMTEEVDGAAVRNCVVVGTGAVAVIFGHGNSNGWTVQNCTVGLGGYGLFSLTGKDYRLQDNILWNGALTLVDTLTSDYNFYFLTRADQPVCLKAKPKWTTFLTPEELAAATGQERHSRRGDPRFRSAPFCQAAVRHDDSNRADRLVLRVGRDVGIADFRSGDRIEINGDGVLRRITAVDATAIEFTPPLPVRPFRDALVWNWKQAASTVLDLRPQPGSSALTAGQGSKPVGADLDIPAFQRGSFHGEGKREIPELPEDLQAALPDPNHIVIPLHGR